LAILLYILRKDEARLCRTCCVRSGLDVVGGVATIFNMRWLGLGTAAGLPQKDISVPSCSKYSTK